MIMMTGTRLTLADRIKQAREAPVVKPASDVLQDGGGHAGSTPVPVPAAREPTPVPVAHTEAPAEISKQRPFVLDESRLGDGSVLSGTPVPDPLVVILDPVIQPSALERLIAVVGKRAYDALASLPEEDRSGVQAKITEADRELTNAHPDLLRVKQLLLEAVSLAEQVRAAVPIEAPAEPSVGDLHAARLAAAVAPVGEEDWSAVLADPAADEPLELDAVPVPPGTRPTGRTEELGAVDVVSEEPTGFPWDAQPAPRRSREVDFAALAGPEPPRFDDDFPEVPRIRVGETRVGGDVVSTGPVPLFEEPPPVPRAPVSMVDTLVSAIGLRLGSAGAAEDIKALVEAVVKSAPTSAPPVVAAPIDVDTIVRDVTAKLLPEVEARVRRQVRETLDPFMKTMQGMVDGIVDVIEGKVPQEGEPTDIGLMGRVANLRVGFDRAGEVLETAFGRGGVYAKATHLVGRETTTTAVLNLVLSAPAEDVETVLTASGEQTSLRVKVGDMARDFGVNALTVSLNTLSIPALQDGLLARSNLSAEELATPDMQRQISERVQLANHRVDVCLEELRRMQSPGDS